jgi:hypothetical protein
VNAQDQYERAVGEMRAQFLAVSGQIADELTRLAQHVASSSPGVRERVITAAAQIASTQQFLRAEADRLPSDPEERYVIMESVLQAQQGALHQLAIIVKQHAPGWYPSLSQTASWHPSVPNGNGSWPPGQAAAPPPAAEANGSNPTAWYPSPPTVQDLATHGWPHANGNGYPADTQPATAQPGWPMGASGVMVPVPYGGANAYGGAGAYEAPPQHAPWPGRRGYAPSGHGQYEPRELRPARNYASGSGQTLPARRRPAEIITYGAGSNNLLWIGIGVLALIFVYLSFPWEIRRKDAVAEQKQMQAAEDRAQPAAVPPAPPAAAPQQAPTMMARAPEVVEPTPVRPTLYPPVASGTALPAELLIGSQYPAAGNPSPYIGRELPIETAAVQPDPLLAPARTKQRPAPSRVELDPATPAQAEAPPRVERFVAVLFTHQDEPTTAQAFADLQLQYPNLLANRQGETQSVDLGRKGVWHRLVVLPAGPRLDAVSLCGQLAGAGYDRCWVKVY